MTNLPTIFGPAPYIATGLSATGSTQAQALGLSAQINVFGTVGAGTGAQLPGFPTAPITVVNNGANALSLYPGVGDQIGNGSTNAAISIGVSQQATYAMLANSVLTPPPRTWQEVGDDLGNGGTVTGNLVVTGSVTVTGSVITGANTLSVLENFASIVPAGSSEATATAIPAQVTQLGTAASTTGVVFGSGGGTLPIGEPLLLLNTGSAAVHVYGNGYSIDTIAGTTGVTLTNGFACWFTPTGTAAIASGPKGTIAS